MTDAQQAKIFEAFAQADISATRHFDGAGLGLVIARALAELMGGKIGLTSAPDNDSKFVVTISLPQTAPPAPMSVPAPIATALSRPLVILAAEDNKANQRVLMALLRDANVALTMVENGELAVAEAEKQDFDLFLIDIMMPEMDGITACRTIRDARRLTGRAMPRAIAFTAMSAPNRFTTITALASLT